VSRNQGLDWQPLLDYRQRVDSLDHIDFMVLSGLDLWLLQVSPVAPCWCALAWTIPAP
jgi:hypothetical protein